MTGLVPGSPGGCLGADVMGKGAAGMHVEKWEAQSSLEFKGSALLEK